MTSDGRKVFLSKPLLFLCLLLVMLTPTGSPEGEQAADTILANGRIYTVDARHTRAQAMAIRNGKLTCKVRPYFPPLPMHTATSTAAASRTSMKYPLPT
jgi:hypothetical protein